MAEAVTAYLALAVDRLADYSSSICSWHNSGEKLRNTFGRFAFPIVWDFAEVVPTSQTSGGYLGAIEWISMFLRHSLGLPGSTPRPSVVRQSSVQKLHCKLDVILTDPPYYDAIPYSDLMDFFHVWLRRTLFGLSTEFDESFCEPLGPKWDRSTNDGELVDDPARHGWDMSRSKSLYEEGMFRTFQSCREALEPDGRLVIVFAHKYPDAWESLVSAIIRAGYVVDGSWPIQTEMTNRTRALSSSALSSSVWLVCKKRPETARPGWDNRVLDEMRGTSTPGSATTGTRASAAPTSSGRRPVRRWRRTASIRSSRRPTSRAGSWRSPSSSATSAAWSSISSSAGS
jgi:putative DNA methylase